MTPKPYCNGQWTAPRFRSFVISALRRASCRWAPKYSARKGARIGRNQYRCASCSAIVGNKDIAVDHIQPVVDPACGFTTWDDYIARMFVEADGYQAICRSCHAAKTKQEREVRKTRKT
jgi:5-methylcytosine-specific restriction endonuclease McrA